MSRRALVTGGAGFIGSHLVRRLVERGYSVTVLDDFSTGRHENLAGLAVDIIEGDVRDSGLCTRAAADTAVIFHLAAMVSVPATVADPLQAHEVNVTGTLNLLLAARAQGTRRFVLSSSASVYGNVEATALTEDSRLSPESPYAAGKAAAELYCRTFWALFGLETVVLRYFNVFGPGQRPDSPYAAVIPLFIEALRTGCPPIVYGDGLQTRDFTYVSNVVDANVLASEQDVAGEVFNIACGTSVSLLEVLTALQKLIHCDAAPVYGSARVGDIKHSRANVRHAVEKLGYRPLVTLGDGLRRLIEAGDA